MTKFTSPVAADPAVDADNTDNGIAVYGRSANGVGVYGEATGTGRGVLASGVGGTGVHGQSADAVGVYGEATGTGRGVVASSVGGYGLRATSTSSSAIWASSASGVGIEGAGGTSGSAPSAAGATDGVVGTSSTGNGVRGETAGSGAGVVGTSLSGNGVFGNGHTGGSFDGSFEGVHAVSHDKKAAGIAGYNDYTGPGPGAGPGIYGKSLNGPAGYFAGDVDVTGNIVVHGDIQMVGADVAEHFAVADEAQPEPGTVMVLDGVDRVRTSDVAYDRKVIGVISGAGGYRPGVLLDHRAGVPGRHPLAMVGKVYCKIDATHGPVDVGDLLTTSPTPGHAMKAADGARAFGAVLGKAMAPLPEGLGLLPVLVALQ